VRIVCANTQAAAIAGAASSFGISHTGGAQVAIQEARNALGLTWRYIDAFEGEAAKLYAAPMDVEQVRGFAAELVKVEQADSDAARTRRREQANGHRETVRVLAHRRPDRRYPVGRLQRGQRMGGVVTEVAIHADFHDRLLDNRNPADCETTRGREASRGQSSGHQLRRLAELGHRGTSARQIIGWRTRMT
jgi:Domain of unknown function (DUF932)